jgi:hypothetical protein
MKEDANAQNATEEKKQHICKNCCFWKPAEGDNAGHCHRYAPRPAFDTPSKADSIWAITSPDDFCGDFKNKHCNIGTWR